ncbi:MAG: sulfite exporter TauE/SafE family protein, partial [Anaerolineae bacterium]
MDLSFLLFVAVGFVAQIVDGALGMAYGVTSTSFLLGLGIPFITPAVASASVHASEIFTTAVSGLSHLRFGNVDRSLFKRLLIPGVIGGALGAYVLTAVPGRLIKPFVALYLMAMGLLILRRAFQKKKESPLTTRFVLPLGIIGGFFDAIGGGGWGPIVTSTLVARGKNPRFAVGSVNLAEFFVTLAESVTFVLTIGQSMAQL